MTRAEHPHPTDDIGCLQALELCYAYLDGELEASEVEGFEQHMAHCRSCYSRSELEGLITAHLRDVAAEPAPAALKRRLRTLLDQL